MRRLALLGALLLPGMAQAQLFGGGLGTDTLHGAAPFGNPIADDRVYIHGFFDQLEGRLGNGSYFRWDGQAWIGNDYNKLWLKSEGRYDVDRKGTMTDGDHELLYDRPVSTYFDVQGGIRVDLDSLKTRTWAALGIQGLAIDFWKIEATLYASDGGHFALKTNASYDLLLTQRLILQPQFETNWYTKTDPGRRIGSGFRTSIWACGCATSSAASWRPISASLTSARSAARPATRARMAATSTTCASWPGCGSGSDRFTGRRCRAGSVACVATARTRASRSRRPRSGRAWQAASPPRPARRRSRRGRSARQLERRTP